MRIAHLYTCLHNLCLGFVHLGIADGMSVARGWACRYSKSIRESMHMSVHSLFRVREVADHGVAFDGRALRGTRTLQIGSTSASPTALMWINNAGHRSYYCGLTMPATVQIIAHRHVYRAGHSRAGTPSDRLCILVIITNSGISVIITNSGILVIITNMPHSKRQPRRELPDDTRRAASARACTCPRTCLHACLCAWLRVVLVEVADNDVVVDVGLRGDSIP